MNNYILFAVGCLVACLTVVGALTKKDPVIESEQFSGTDPRNPQGNK